MSQQVPPYNNGVPQGNAPMGNDMVAVGGYADASPDYVPQGSDPAQYGGGGGQPPTYDPQNYARNKVPMIDPIESAKLTPQLMVLLVLSGLRRHWKWSLPMGLFAGLLAGGILYLAMPVRYEATAQIQIRAFRPRLIDQDVQQGRYEDFVNTQFAFMRGNGVIDRALDDSNVTKLSIILKQTDKKGWLVRNLSVNPIRRSEVVNVSIATDSKDSSVKIVDAVVDAYFNFIGDLNRDATNTLISSLRTEERRQRQIAQQLQETIRVKTKQAALQGAVAGEQGLASGFGQGESLARDLNLAIAKLRTMTAQRRAITERMEQPTQIPRSMLINMNPELKNLNTQREDLVRRREGRVQAINSSNDPLVTQLNRQIEGLDARINDLSSGVDSAAMETMKNYFRIQEDINLFNLEQEIKIQEIMVDELSTKHAEQLARSVERAENVLDASFEQAQLARTNATLSQIEDRILSVTTELRAPGQISQLTRAVPSEPNLIKQIMIIGGGTTVFAFFPLLLSIAVERMKPRLYHVSQVRRATPLVLIGEIMEPPVSWVHGATFRKRLARYRESVHNWCTHLLLSDPFRSCRTLSVASVAGDDGKTFLAVQIAVAMAQMKAGKVLLIDGDMRVGRLHLLFGNEETGIGLADVLSFRNAPGEAIVQNEKEPNLELLSAGQLDMSPYELLGDGRFRELLDALEQSPSNPSGYELIIVVLPPVANAAESLIMAASTDSTLLCVRQGETVLAAMEDVYRKLVNTGAAVDGIVVKDIPYYQMAGRDGGFADRLEQIRLSHLLQYAD